MDKNSISLNLRHKAMDLLALREHSRVELTRKLRQREFSEDMISQELDKLEQEKLLSDERFAQAYARMRINKGFGPRRIALELKERGISKQLVDTVLSESDTIWAQRAANALGKRFGRNPSGELSERVKQKRFLEYRGFSYEQIELGLQECTVHKLEQNF